MLTGWVSRPASGGTAKLPAIFLIHGGSSLSSEDERFGPRKLLESKAITTHLAKKYVIFSVEYKSRYFADDLEFESIKAAYKVFKKLPDVDKNRIAVMGISHGGFLALLAVLNPDLDIKAKAVVSVCGVVDLAMHVRYYEELVKKDKFAQYDSYGVSGVKNRLGWPPDKSKQAKTAYQNRSALTYAKNLNIPLLLVHGKADKFVPFEQTERLAVELDKYGKSYELHAVPGFFRGHHFLIFSRGKVKDWVADFLAKNL
ncbi:MAG: prolyl oligopeptidase family serine peptidase [Pseudomonadota bacterium]|nr:prolyl oligopeptidase family serine peptidase [Pseudomonadota bacterium]